MNIALACVLTAGVLPIVAAVVSKWGFRGYDNRNPRAWLAGQTGFRARANAAQANSWAFIVARVLYLVLYVADRATLRSLVWTVGWGCSVALYVSAL